jgi:hypothetical protein
MVKSQKIFEKKMGYCVSKLDLKPEFKRNFKRSPGRAASPSVTLKSVKEQRVDGS